MYERQKMTIRKILTKFMGFRLIFKTKVSNDVKTRKTANPLKKHVVCNGLNDYFEKHNEKCNNNC